MADAKSPLAKLSDTWPKNTSLHVLVGNPMYANVIRQSLAYMTPSLREVADGLGVNYRTLQSYAAMERVGPPEFGAKLEKHLRVRIHNFTVLANVLAKLLEEEAKRERAVREVQEKREQRVRELEQRWDQRDREFTQRWGKI